MNTLYSRSKILHVTIVLLIVFSGGCETVKGVSQDLGNTARNVRDVIRLGEDIQDISK